MRHSFRFAALVGVLALAGQAFADPKNPTFDDDVLPVLKQHCVGCHSNDKQKGGLNLATFAAMKAGGSSGDVVKPGDPDKSRLYSLTNHTEEPKMPPKGDKIPAAQLDTLKLWIEQGGRENAGSKVTVTKPKVDIGLKTVAKGKPDVPPMPLAGKLKLDPVVKARRAGAVLALAASPWAPLVAVGGQKQVLLYHADSGELLGILPFDGQINSLKFSRTGKYVLAAGGRGGHSGKAILFNVETGEKVTEVGSAESDAILSADISADQTMIAVGTPTKMVRIYATADGTVSHSIKKHTDWVTAVEFSPDGVLLATGDRNGGVFVWEAATAREFHSIRGHTACVTDVSWRSDSNLLATGSEDGTVRLWEMENASQVKNWNAHPGGVQAVRFAMDGKLASTGRDKLTKTWDAAGTLQKQFDAFTDIGLRVAVAYDGKRVFAGDWTGAIKAWTAADGKFAFALDGNPAPVEEQIKEAEFAVSAAEIKARDTAEALKSAQSRLDDANKELLAAQARLQKVNADLAAAQRKLDGENADAKKAKTVVDSATADVNKFGPLKVQAAQTAATKATALKTAADAFNKAKQAAAADPKNKQAQQALAKATADVQTANNEVQQATKLLNDIDFALKNAQKQVADANKVLATSQKDIADAEKKVKDLAPTVKAATDGVPPVKADYEKAKAAVGPAKTAADAAAAELAAAKAKLDKLKEKK